ncbi:MAG: glycosyltransferase, partial [Bacteroidota bacterium]
IAGRVVSNYSWLLIFRQAIRKYIAEKGRPDLVHIHVPFKAGILGLWIKRKFKIPYIVTEHWTIYQPQNIVPYGQLKYFLRSVLHRVIKRSSLLLPVSRDLGVLMNDMVAKKEFSVIENVANEKYFYYAGAIKTGSPFTFIHVSTMSYQKNAEGIIESFTELREKFPGTRLVIVGPAPVTIKQLISQTGLLDKNIFLRGEISYPEVANEMQQSNALVLFSRFENSPCSIIEALCCGLPVIATAVGGIPELLDQNNGLLVNQGDKGSLTRNMETMIANYQQYDQQKIAEQAKKQFSYPVIGKKIDEIYRAISTATD